MDIYMARQPILDKNKVTVAYELLFRDGLNNSMNQSINGYNATQNILSNSMVAFGLGKLADNKKTFINFTGRNIENGDVLLLPAETAVIEILENTEPTESLLDICSSLKEKGYKFALDDFVFDPKYQPFIDLADIIKVDFLITDTIAERQMMRKIVPPHVKLLAEKIETEDEYRQALSLGYELFQGYFFCKPVMLSQKTVQDNETSQFLLLKEMNCSDLNTRQIENIIKQDVSLIHKLLRYINSPYIGLANTVDSIKQAINLLGLKGMRKWVNLVCLRSLSANRPNELFVILLIRAKFCELVVEKLDDKNLEKDTAFLSGMLSLSDVILNQPMDKVIDDLGLTADIKDALLFRSNKIGKLLQLVTDYEHGLWPNVTDWCRLNHFPDKLLSSLYNEAVYWAIEINENLTN